MCERNSSSAICRRVRSVARRRRTASSEAVGDSIGLSAVASASPRRAARLLARGREFTLQHERIVVNVVLLGLALLFLTRGLLDLSR